LGIRSDLCVYFRILVCFLRIRIGYCRIFADMSTVHTFRLDLTWDLLQAIRRMDRFAGEWVSIERREGRSLKHLKSIATVQSVGASTRIEGSRLADPEIPVIGIRELDVLRDVQIDGDRLLVTNTPTYSGCPAMDVVREDTVKELHAADILNEEVKQVLDPAWTTDWISGEGKAKLLAYGIAPSEKTADIRALKGEQPIVACPQCGRTNTVMVSAFGSTACEALWKCTDCLEPFDQFKCLWSEEATPTDVSPIRSARYFHFAV